MAMGTPYLNPDSSTKIIKKFYKTFENLNTDWILANISKLLYSSMIMALQICFFKLSLRDTY